MSAPEPPRLHEAQADVPHSLVARLIADQAPQWSHLPLTPLSSDGTVHRVDLLGTDMVVRVPIIDWGEDEAGDDSIRLPLLATALAPTGVRVPTQLFRGEPAAGMAWHWGVYRRLPGRHPDPTSPGDQRALVDGLSAVIRALRANQALHALGTGAAAIFDFQADDAATRPHVVALGSGPALAAWDAAVELAAREPAAPTSWVHGDLLPGNLLIEDVLTGLPPRLTGVIDWGASGIGDPALDLLPAWACLHAPARRELLEAVGATPTQIVRARAYAVRKAAWGVPYYARTLPSFAATLEYALAQVESDDL